ncbi:pyridoxal kinase PdxY [Nocardioides panacis]|uniref:Pyridoxal kinase PdxY n=1 Tax=Nocardioides panacis TaxID=2849501 RepID=A0A975SZB3_9ACTN|nr:pyridoxal kinase PdxY [Nocardioides panacis]QWZ08175.1 pyridoxal kinase PdxY [Nocardioides panacis]
MGILSIQSLVAYGHAGNSAAVFPLQRLGKVVWPVMTVHFSNHTGYGAWRGPLLAADDVAEVIAGVEERGAFETCEAVLSGYQGAEDVGAVVLDAVARVKALNPRAIYCCDPVMGDVGRGMFVRAGIPEFMRDRVVPAADVVTPNHFELDYLAGTTSTTIAGLLEAADRVRATGPSVVLVTSAVLDDTPADALDLVAVSPDGAWRTRTPRLPVTPNGTGDLTTAVFLAHLLDGRALEDALARTTSAVFAVVEATAAAGERELRIVQTQDRLAEPRMEFDALRVR